ncbi:MAG TPA: MFS transporter [Lachnospiraceae bacterium]|nr:MFS transporter [uncultured Lachnoclostridium sp.]HAU85523.1 MFS transporter [Lachnospiraceae bacterium]
MQQQKDNQFKIQNFVKKYISFFYLWQGELISTFGDSIYSMALGFWVFKITGSTTMIGAVMLASTLPEIIFAPVAGVIVDRYNKKAMLVSMDTIRSITMIILAVQMMSGNGNVVSLVVGGIILGICGTIYSPCVMSLVSLLVSKDKITNANSVLSLASAVSQMTGNVSGGFIYNLLGAPIIFLSNGISFLLSGFLNLKIKYTEKHSERHDENMLKEMKEGVQYIKGEKGLICLLLMGAALNFFSYMAIILVLPLFEIRADLGSTRYGVAMGCFMAGAMAGYVMIAIARISNKNRLKLIFFSNVLTNICFIIAVNCRMYCLMLILLFIGGIFNSVLNTIISSIIQIASPSDMRGKVLSLKNMTIQGLTPIAMGIGGVLGDIFNIQAVISCSFGAALIVVTLFLAYKPLREFVHMDFDTD